MHLEIPTLFRRIIAETKSRASTKYRRSILDAFLAASAVTVAENAIYEENIVGSQCKHRVCTCTLLRPHWLFVVWVLRADLQMLSMFHPLTRIAHAIVLLTFERQASNSKAPYARWPKLTTLYAHILMDHVIYNCHVMTEWISYITRSRGKKWYIHLCRGRRLQKFMKRKGSTERLSNFHNFWKKWWLFTLYKLFMIVGQDVYRNSTHLNDYLESYSDKVWVKSCRRRDAWMVDVGKFWWAMAMVYPSPKSAVQWDSGRRWKYESRPRNHTRLIFPLPSHSR